MVCFCSLIVLVVVAPSNNADVPLVELNLPGIYSHARLNVPLVHCMYLFHMAGEACLWWKFMYLAFTRMSCDVYLWWRLCTLCLLACQVRVPEAILGFATVLCGVFRRLINSPYLVGPVLRFPDTTVPQPFYCKRLTLKTEGGNSSFIWIFTNKNPVLEQPCLQERCTFPQLKYKNQKRKQQIIQQLKISITELWCKHRHQRYADL